MSTQNTLLDTVSQLEVNQRIVRRRAFSDVLAGVVGGRVTSPEEILESLKQTGETLDELKAKSPLLVQRLEADAKIKAASSVDDERSKLVAASARELEIYQTAKARYDSVVLPNIARISETEVILNAADESRIMLTESAGDVYREVVTTLRSRLGELQAAKASLESQIAIQTTRRDEIDARMQSEGRTATEREAERDSRTMTISQLQVDLSGVEKQIDAVVTDLDKANAALLDPLSI